MCKPLHSRTRQIPQKQKLTTAVELLLLLQPQLRLSFVRRGTYRSVALACATFERLPTMKTILWFSVLALVLTFAACASADTLKDFTFYISGASGVSLRYEAEVYHWSGSLIAASNKPQGGLGAPVFTTGSLTYTGTGAFQAVTISPNVFLSPGPYVALFTISRPADYANSTGTTSWGALLFSHVTGNGGGGFNFYNNGNNYAAIGTTPWDDYSDFGDLAWTAHFSSGLTFDTTYAWDGSSSIQSWGTATTLQPNPTSTYGETFLVATPEPGSLMLLATGVIGLAGAIRRKLF